MNIRHIFMTIAAIMLASAALADSSSVTSKKYVDDFMAGYQNKIPGSGADKLMIYDDTDGIGAKQIVSSLGASTSATNIPDVGAVKTGIDGKQDTINGTAGYVMTGTGTAGNVGERAIYSASTNYSNALVTAETVNTGVINAVNSSLIRVNENGVEDSNGTLWEINTNLFAFNFLPTDYTQLAYLQGNGYTRIIPNVTINSNLRVDIKYEIITSGWLFGGTIGTEGRWGLTSGSNFYSGTTGVADTSGATNLSGINIASFDYKTGATVNGVNIPFDSVQTYGNVTKKAFYLFTADGTSVRTQEHKIYYTKIYDNNILIRDMIPVRRENDGALGMYDTVSGTFFQNQGTGTFTAGPACLSPNLYGGSYYSILVQSSTAYNPIAIQGDTWTADGTRRGIAKIIPVKPNTTYTFSYSSAQGANSPIVTEYASVEDMTNSSNAIRTSSSSTFTTSATTKYLLIGIWGYPTPVAGTVIGLTNPQLEQGSTATTYRPYGENICD